MIVNIRIELTDEQRSVLSLRLRPKALKRLASRKDVLDNLALTFRIMSGQEQSIEQPRRDLLDLASKDSDPYHTRPDFVPITNDIIDDKEPAYMGSIVKVCAEYKKINGLRRLIESVTNAMFALVNAERVSKEHHTDSTARLKELRLLVQDYRYELADIHDNESTGSEA